MTRVFFSGKKVLMQNYGNELILIACDAMHESKEMASRRRHYETLDDAFGGMSKEEFEIYELDPEDLSSG